MTTPTAPVTGRLDGRVAIITGAGAGLGREHALRLAAEGARVVVNDLAPGDGRPDLAAAVADEIAAAGGTAVAVHADVSDWQAAGGLIESTLQSFGRVDVVVNNAGVLRDALLVAMDEAEWDDVMRVHLKGHAALSHHAGVHWRERSKRGDEVAASVVNTSSTSGLFGNVGQANYAAAKAGIIGLTLTTALELERYGVRANVLVPAARTAMTESVPALRVLMRAPEDPADFDPWHPAHVSTYVAWLASATCPLNGSVVFASGRAVRPVQTFFRTEGIAAVDAPISVETLDERLPGLVAALEPRA
ncbi:SDR family NAD(P)-dependent oxidoreductase [Micromonospora sp. HUAS LYJ1]|uniref:SDR family NAD(P)-dependent oxidoreductase n=1 Tax=Micromonospora sp. HUAS LYJ1 TaxID=3061626 RepID=UPI002673C401|nr:SDR family NAD(P)-dependent oxidoreductase [Micromonospora sp. HUAS LYJ1]WKU03540.1 SDR family NAD(P)-dependent oxidoreductase [Micromonospora sp. HUAS LYJ1]